MHGESEAETCWSVIHGAALGDEGCRETFCRRYLDVLRAFFGSRWKQPSQAQILDDAVQEVFLECLKEKGVLARANESAAGGFRAYLFAVARNVALRVERREAKAALRGSPPGLDLDRLSSDETSMSNAFDRAWAAALLREAAAIQREQAQALGPEGMLRVEILSLRFKEDLPIRDIAKRLGRDPAQVHHEYAKARKEFKKALETALAFHHPGASAQDLESEGQRILSLFS